MFKAPLDEAMLSGEITRMNDIRELEEIYDGDADELVEELEQDEPESDFQQNEAQRGPQTEVAIENKYTNSQGQIFIQRNDFLIPNILQMVVDRDIIDISPTYQRRMRWPDKKKSHLIESLLMNVPIPPIFLYEHAFSKYEVMDGQQRLATIREFFDNEFVLRDLKNWPELNGRRFVDLPPKIKSALTRRGLAAVIILTESSPDEKGAMELRQYVFERLNTGGERLNAQEVRNCIYASPFNDILHEIARSNLFTHVWGIPPRESGEPQQVSRRLTVNRLYSTMADCEIVLRYFALLDLTQFKGGMKRTLDKYMENMVPLKRKSCSMLKNEYLHVLGIARDVYEDHLFRLPGKNGNLNGRQSVPLSDAILIAIRDNMAGSDQIVERRAYVIDETKRLLSAEESYEALVGRGNTRKAIETRISIMGGVFQEAANG